MPDLDFISTTPTAGPAPAKPPSTAPPRGVDDPGRRRWTATLPMRTALVAVAAVWLLGCIWSYQEQSEFAAANGFALPHLLPLVIDGFAVSMAGVSWAASLDARPAISARLATLIAVAGSSASNGVWAWLRTHHDPVTVALGVAVPVAANLAFEVLLGELRRQVQRRRGLPAPVAIPYPRVIRFVLAPWSTFRDWRSLVLELTADHLTTSAVTTTEPGTAATFTARPAHEPISQPAQAAPPAVSPPPTAPLLTLPPLTPPPSTPAHSYEQYEMALTAATVMAEPATPETALPSDGSPSRQPHPPSPPTTPVPAFSTSAPVPPALRAPAPLAPKPTRRTRELSAITIAAATERTSRQDTRVTTLAHHLATAEDPDQITGEQVTELLGIHISPRTGRRLLDQARELLDRNTDPTASHEHRLSVAASH